MYKMSKITYFAKSFEEDFILKRLKGKKKIDFQSIHDIINTRTIKPNTKSFGRDDRLACSILHKNYLKTYRSRGVIFKAKSKPDFVYPFDLILLSNAKKIIVQYYRIKDNLHMYYNHKLLKGYEKFVFRDINKLLRKFSSPKIAWKEVNKFRVNHGHKQLSRQKYKLVEFNEAIFHKSIKIDPVAIFGYSSLSRKIAKQYGLPHFRSVKEFWEKLK